MKEYLVSITTKRFGEHSSNQQEISVYADADNIYEALSKGQFELMNNIMCNETEQLITSELSPKQEVELKNHTLTHDKLITKICVDREMLWDKLVSIFKLGKRSWNLTEIEEAIKSLQEYFSLDYPTQQFVSSQQYCRIIDNLLRTSLYYNSMVKNEKHIDNGDLSYITKKVMEIFIAIGIAK